MSDQEEEKPPWYATELMEDTYVLFLIALIFLAFMGWNEFLKLLLAFVIPCVILAALIAYLTKRFINEGFWNRWLLCTPVVMVLYLLGVHYGYLPNL